MFEPFRFFKHRRERRGTALAAERAHQLALIEAQNRQLETVLENALAQTRESALALIEVAKSNAAQAAAFTNWIDSFRITAPPTTSVVRDEDEWKEEQTRIAAELGLPTDPSQFPEEFKLALELHRDIADSSPA